MKRRIGLLADLRPLLLLGVGVAGWLVVSRSNPRQAPAFEAVSLQGQRVMVSPGERSRCLLLFFCMCADCHHLALQLAKSPYVADRTLQIVGVVHSTPEAVRGFREQTRFPGLLFADPMGEVKRRYGVGPCPNAWLIDPGGAVFFHQREPIRWSELTRRLGGWITSG
jgi:peroxiredoxin